MVFRGVPWWLVLFSGLLTGSLEARSQVRGMTRLFRPRQIELSSSLKTTDPAATNDLVQVETNHEDCRICLQELFHSDAKVRCHHSGGKHAFHTHCIESWRSRGRSECPLCRQELFTDEEMQDVKPTIEMVERKFQTLMRLDVDTLKDLDLVAQRRKQLFGYLAQLRTDPEVEASTVLDLEGPVTIATSELMVYGLERIQSLWSMKAKMCKKRLLAQDVIHHRDCLDQLLDRLRLYSHPQLREVSHVLAASFVKPVHEVAIAWFNHSVYLMAKLFHSYSRELDLLHRFRKVQNEALAAAVELRSRKINAPTPTLVASEEPTTIDVATHRQELQHSIRQLCMDYENLQKREMFDDAYFALVQQRPSLSRLQTWSSKYSTMCTHALEEPMEKP